ncbi:LUD domain-containing protein [Alicyclobacillus tolerans]|uniref:LutC/YkgG family protein n=1 Tax=Alicyclobacillus tolerans TaxID=90970 RepID=UPI001F489650|nr:LUD domain-containing protein [Alicyclobacillus tolerans]MCF8566255.1 LUD domain-containing protein [Alicyclobacillus tolerans]
MKEEDFFANIARRLGRPQPLASAPSRDVVGAPGFWQDYRLADVQQRIAKFQEELEKLGGQAKVYVSLESMQEGLADLLEQLQPEKIGCWNERALEEFQLSSVLAGRQTQYWDGAKDPSALVSEFASVDVGITGADFAIADTGTIAVVANGNQGRSVSLLPSVHIAIVKSSSICTRMGEVLAEVAKMQADDSTRSSSINFITGPSRSSDIENDLSIGVHGPAAVFALVLRDE